MDKRRPIRNSELESRAAAAEQHANSGRHFSDIPRHRWPLIILFFAVTIGSFIVWSFFSRTVMLDEYSYDVIAEYSHDSTSFTQGLIFRDGFVFESSGKYGRSRVSKYRLDNKPVVKQVPLEARFFGEGLCAVNDKLIQLTWKSNVAFVYDMDLNKVDEFHLDTQGWGLTFDGLQLILSDGSSTIRFLDPDTYEVKRTIYVRKGALRMDKINELEYINNVIYANVLDDDTVYMISPVDGKVTGRINFQELYPRNKRDDESVLNGIAIRPNGNLLITGKNWPSIFEVKLKPISR